MADDSTAPLALRLAAACQARKQELGWTYRKLAAESGVPLMTCHRALQGHDVRLSAAIAIARALGVRIEVEQQVREQLEASQ